MSERIDSRFCLEAYLPLSVEHTWLLRVGTGMVLLAVQGEV